MTRDTSVAEPRPESAAAHDAGVPYRRLDEVRQSLSVNWYRCPVEPGRLRELAGRSDRKGLVQAGGHLALFVTTGAATWYCFGAQWWLAFVLALFCHGTVGSFFKGLAVHELGHGTVFATKWLNGLFLRVFSLISWWNFHEYAMSHTYHHRYTLHPLGDREVVLPREPSLQVGYLLQLFTFNIFGGLESNGLLPVLRETVNTARGKFSREWIQALYAEPGREVARRRAINWARLVLAFHLGVLVVGIAFELWALPIVLTLYLFIGNWLKYFVGLPMHCGLRSDVADFRKCVRTIKLDPISEFLYWRMNWHIEHHMFAAIPCYNLEALHRVVADDMPAPRSLLGAWREMRTTWRRQREEPGYEFDTPVPSSSPAGFETPDSLAASIGDLAPAELASIR